MENLAGKRLVILGCGYVGAAVARWGTTVGLRVTALTRNAATALLLREVGIETVVGDLADSAWHSAIEGAPEFALDCVSSGGGGVEGYRRSYLEGMESVVAWSQARGAVGTFVYTSSTSVYPQGAGARVDEGMPATPDSDRAQVLVETENRVRSAVGAWQRWIILRLAGIYGPGRHELLEQVRRGEVGGSPDRHLNLIHRDDIVTAVAACFGAPATVGNEVFNVADDGEATKGEIVAWIAGAIRTSPPTFTGTATGGRRSMTPDRVIVNTRLKNRLGWSPRYSTFREGYASLLSR